MALKILVAPLRYVQGPNALLQLGAQLVVLGIKNPLILVSPSAKKAVGPAIDQSLGACGISYAYVDFGGSCTWKEIYRVRDACIEGGHDAIINCGGGQVLDAGRCAATGRAMNVEKNPPEVFPKFGAGVPCINVPTVAATDASTSAVSLVYSEKHTLEATMVFPANPTMVFVDTAVIARSPVRLFVSGMGDALATYFEADMCRRTLTPSLQTGALGTRSALALGRLCFDLLMEYGVQAKAEVEAQVTGPALEAVAEANVLLSGLGFESVGICAAHAVGHSLLHIAEYFESPRYHGELVAFGTLTQLVLEARTPEYLKKIFAFCRGVGLPTTFEELTLRNLTDQALEIAALVASKDILIRSLAGARSERDEQGRFYDHLEIASAMKTADMYGRKFGR